MTRRSTPGEAPPAVRRWVLTPIAWLTGLAFFVPVAWVTIGAFRPTAEIQLGASLSLDLFVPHHLTLSNFDSLLTAEFRTSILNSLFVAAMTTLLGLCVAALAGFALSAIEFPLRGVIFAIVVISFTIPADATAFALLSLIRGWGLGNSYPGLILPLVADGMAIFLLRQFFLGISRDLIEAARLEGAGWMRILLTLYLPLAKPALIGAGMILFVNQWTSYLWPLLVSTSPDMDLAQVSLVKVATGRYATDWGQLFAGAVVLSAVPAAILLPLQRYFVQSLSTSGLRD